MASGDDAGSVILRETNSWTEIARFTAGSKGAVLSLAFSPDGKRVLCGREDHEVNVWSIEQRRVVLAIRGRVGWQVRARFSPDGSTIAVAGPDLTSKPSFMLVDSQHGTVRETLNWSYKNGDVSVDDITFSHDGKHITVAAGSSVVLWNWDGLTANDMRRISTKDSVYRLQFSPDNRQLVVAGNEGSLCLMDIASLKKHWQRQLVGARFPSVAFDPKRPLLFLGATFDNESGRAWGKIRVLETEIGNEIRSRIAHDGYIRDLAIDPSGEFLATAGDDAVVRIWKVADVIR
jgi:WD40 repeat protein